MPDTPVPTNDADPPVLAAPVHTRCCNGGCRRTLPILIRRGGLSGRWYVVTRYKERQSGVIEATEKHDVTGDLTQELIAAGWTPPMETP